MSLVACVSTNQGFCLSNGKFLRHHLVYPFLVMVVVMVNERKKSMLSAIDEKIEPDCLLSVRKA